MGMLLLGVVPGTGLKGVLGPIITAWRRAGCPGPGLVPISLTPVHLLATVRAGSREEGARHGSGGTARALRADGAVLRDEHGRQRILHGINLVDKGAPGATDPAAFRGRWTAEDLDQLVGIGL